VLLKIVLLPIGENTNHNMKNEKISQNRSESMIPFTVLDVPGILSYTAAYINPNIIPHIIPYIILYNKVNKVLKTQIIIKKLPLGVLYR